MMNSLICSSKPFDPCGCRSNPVCGVQYGSSMLLIQILTGSYLTGGPYDYSRWKKPDRQSGEQGQHYTLVQSTDWLSSLCRLSRVFEVPDLFHNRDLELLFGNNSL